MKNSHRLVFLFVLLVAACGAAFGGTLPEAGIDKFDAVVEMTVTGLGPDPTPFKLFLTGPVVVQRGAPQMTTGEHYTIATETVSLNLSGTDLVLCPDPVHLRVELIHIP